MTTDYSPVGSNVHSTFMAPMTRTSVNLGLGLGTDASFTAAAHTFRATANSPFKSTYAPGDAGVVRNRGNASVLTLFPLVGDADGETFSVRITLWFAEKGEIDADGKEATLGWIPIVYEYLCTAGDLTGGNGGFNVLSRFCKTIAETFGPGSPLSLVYSPGATGRAGGFIKVDLQGCDGYQITGAVNGGTGAHFEYAFFVN